ncbi:MAG: SGNH/GDSL hydrolase family protein [Oscillospiraceae bacterium]|nr:SGNH/GDSL hydrolase family protein [Oscillospiraceae bacterium]
MLELKRLISLALALVTALSLLTACGEKEVVIPDEAGWFTTWAAATQSISPTDDAVPTNPKLKENTLRQQIKVSIGGDKIRLTFSNEYGNLPVLIDSIHIAKLVSEGNPTIDTSTDTVVTFNSGETTAKIEAGATLTTDEINFSFDALDLLAVTIKFGKYVPSDLTVHRESLCTSWITEGDQVSSETFTTMSFKNCWYFLSRVETYAEAGTKTIVCFGDSITDGVGATYNGFDTWPEVLAQKLQENPETQNLSIANTAISGNAVFGGVGQAAKDRFERDVLNVSGVRYVVVMIGINDIGYAQADISEDIINEYKVMIEKCREKGIKIYACTLAPTKGHPGYYSELHELIRDKVNEYILSEESGFDGVIDMSMALASETDLDQMQAIYATGDWLHPNSAGYERMGDEAYRTLINLWAQEKAKADDK